MVAAVNHIMKTSPLRFLGIAACAALMMMTGRVANAAAQIGRPAPDFTLNDVQQKPHRLADYKGKIVVLEWVNPECPFVKKHYNSGNIPKLQQSAAADGVVWLLINSGYPGSQGDYETAKMEQWLKEKNAAPTAYFRDQDAKVGKLYGAKTTPHFFIIDRDGQLVYNGAIDSIRSADPSDIKNAENYVASALEALKKNVPVATPSTQPYGCAVKY